MTDAKDERAETLALVDACNRAQKRIKGILRHFKDCRREAERQGFRSPRVARVEGGRIEAYRCDKTASDELYKAVEDLQGVCRWEMCREWSKHQVSLLRVIAILMEAGTTIHDGLCFRDFDAQVLAGANVYLDIIGNQALKDLRGAKEESHE